MKGLLTLISLIICTAIVLGVPSFASPWGVEYGVTSVFDTGRAVLLCGALASVVIFILTRQPEGGAFLCKIFVSALLLRLLVAVAIFLFRGQEFFGGDAIHYDYLGVAQMQSWAGDQLNSQIVRLGRGAGGAWGMVYMVGAIYSL